MKLLAQSKIDLYDTSQTSLKGFGPLGLEQGQGAIPVFATFISSAIGLITVIGIIWFVFTLITGAVAMITAGSDKASMENARKKIFNGLIGLVVLISGMFILNLIGKLIGIPSILDFGVMFNMILGFTPMSQFDSLNLVR